MSAHRQARSADAPPDWKVMDDFAAGIDGNRLPATGELVGARWRVRRADGVTTELRFTAPDQVAWSRGAESAVDWCEVVRGAPDTFFVDQTFAGTPRTSEVTVADRSTLRTLTVVSTIAERAEPGVPRVSQTFHAGVLDLGDGRAPTGVPPAPTRDLIGWRALYRYSPRHLYEHVYLNSERYAWQCLVGEQRGHGDVDLASAWKLGPDRYVFTFREFRIPVATTWLYDLAALRTTGKFFGISASGRVSNAPGGALITSLGRAIYPDDGQPI